jgi:hypothetical protein
LKRLAITNRMRRANGFGNEPERHGKFEDGRRIDHLGGARFWLIRWREKTIRSWEP